MASNTIMVVGRGVYALRLIRLLSRTFKGSVVLATTSKTDFTAGSKYVTEVFMLPKPLDKPNGEDAYIDGLVRIARQITPFIIFPAIEETFYLSKHKSKFPTYCFIFNSDIKTLELLHNKYEFIRLVKELGLTHPQTSLLCDPEADSMIDSMAILKPIYSRGGLDNVIFKPGDTITVDPTKYIIQEHLGFDTDQNHYSVFGICLKGEVIALCTYQCKFATNGFSAYRTHVETPTEVDHMIKSIVGHTKYTGFMGLDLIKKDSKYYPLECNPRLTNGIGFMKELTVRDAMGIRVIAKANDVYTNRQSLFPAVAYVVTHRTNPLKLINATDDIFSWTDIYPFVVFLFYFIYFILGSIYLKVTSQISSVPEYLKKTLVNEIVTYTPREKSFFID
jgi:predicted ATP-grasp superfamily ATP-dependent carboligase